MEKNCIICNVLFATKPEYTNHKYCMKCSSSRCQVCKKEIKIKPKSKSVAKFCSRDCYYKSMVGKKQKLEDVKKRAESNSGRRTGKEIICEICGKNKYYYPKVFKEGKGRFCSKECFFKWTRTSDNPNWKGDNYPENKRLRGSSKYKNWRRLVFKRDNFSCVICGYKSKGVRPSDIHADHIKSWALYPEERFNLDNGRTLCVPCHKKTDTWGINAKFHIKNNYY